MIKIVKRLHEKILGQPAGIQSKLQQFDSEMKKLETSSNSKKILFAHSFSIYAPCFAHDKLLAYALKLRGFEITASYCDGVQNIECNVYGGVWGGGDNFKNNCKRCQKKSKQLWPFLDKGNIYKFSSYLTKADYSKVDEKLEKLQKGEWLTFIDDGWNIGKLAKDILVNNYVSADYRLVENHEVLGRSHLRNLLLVKIACQKIVEVDKPHRIISNDSYYGMWKIWELTAKKNNIPFYSHWSGTRVGGWCYAFNDASMNLNFSKSWPKFSAIDLASDEKKRVEKWLSDRVAGKEMVLDTASLASYKDEDFDLSKLDSNKPIALLSANVIWDLAALNKEAFTSGMSEWIVETVKWFKDHPEYQLLVKAHPGELHPAIPETKETVALIIKENFPEIPSNVFILSPKVALDVYSLFPISKIGLVFTSSVGMEMVARGIPVITAGKSHYRGYGFTIDPNSLEEYYENLENQLSGKKCIDIEKSMDLALKFIKFNFFHYYSKINLLEFDYGKDMDRSTKLNVKSVLDLKKGNNKHLDYILDCIENGEPIFSEDKWPEES